MFVSYNNVPEANMVITPATCENADGSAQASVTNGIAPYDVYWTTGFSEQISSITQVNNLSSGIYYLNIEDENGCKNVSKANVYDSDVIVSETISPMFCKGQTGSVDLSVSTSGNITSTYWSNGQTSTLMNAPAGEYSVEIHTDNNCNFFGTFEIPDSALKVIVNAVNPNVNCLSTPD